jgi:hypothetical protein
MPQPAQDTRIEFEQNAEKKKPPEGGLQSLA